MGRVGVVSGSLFLLLLSAPALAQCPQEENAFLADITRVADAMDAQWWNDRPLYDVRNAHRTNTKEQFEDALEGGFNWFEGDVRAEINHPDRLEMRHDQIHESGDNRTLREWLDKGKKAGMDEWGAEIRRRFPDAILAINPRGGEGTIDAARVDRMIELATRFGGPVTFVLHEGQVSAAAVAKLQQYGPVSIWGNVDDPEKRRGELRAAGVEGMIDLGHEQGLTPGGAADYVKNQVRTWWDGL